MRYRINGHHAHAAAVVTDHTVLFTVVLSLLLGIVLVRLSLYGRQRWLTFWAASLVLASLIYLVATWLGYQ